MRQRWEHKNATLNNTRPAIEPAISLMPNPANTQIQVEYKNLAADKYTIQVIDMLGRKIYEQPVVISQSYGQQKINVSQWHPGNYIIRLSNNTLNLEQRAVVSR